MSLSYKSWTRLKAMRAKDTVALESLRAKAEILAQTASGSKEEISAADEIKLLQN
jgi:hypothetical protein